MSDPKTCAECGAPISLDTGYAEYEDGPICLECDAATNPLPGDEPDPDDGPGAQAVADEDWRRAHPHDGDTE